MAVDLLKVSMVMASLFLSSSRLAMAAWLNRIRSGLNSVCIDALGSIAYPLWHFSPSLPCRSTQFTSIGQFSRLLCYSSAIARALLMANSLLQTIESLYSCFIFVKDHLQYTSISLELRHNLGVRKCGSCVLVSRLSLFVLNRTRCEVVHSLVLR